MATYSQLVPGGGLARHEAVGGHTLARHIGLTKSQLVERLNNEPAKKRVSTFSDRTIAEAAISEAIALNSTSIAAWQSTSNARLTISYTASSAVGISLIRGTSNIVAANKVKAVLIRANLPLGYYILTAYPEP